MEARVTAVTWDREWQVYIQVGSSGKAPGGGGICAETWMMSRSLPCKGEGRIFQVEAIGQVLKAETSNRKKAHGYNSASQGDCGVRWWWRVGTRAWQLMLRGLDLFSFYLFYFGGGLDLFKCNGKQSENLKWEWKFCLGVSIFLCHFHKCLQFITDLLNYQDCSKCSLHASQEMSSSFSSLKQPIWPSMGANSMPCYVVGMITGMGYRND